MPGTLSAQEILAISYVILSLKGPVQWDAVAPPYVQDRWVSDDHHRAWKWPEIDKRTAKVNLSEVTTQN